MISNFMFKTLDEIPRGESETTLLYGGAGTGKTFFCGTAEARTLFINIGHGIATLQSPLFRKLYPKAAQMLTVTLSVETDKYGMPLDWKYFDQVCDVIDEAHNNFGDQFDTIVIDDGTTLHRYALMKGIETNGQLGKSQTKAQSPKIHLLAPAMQDFQAEMSIIDQFMAGTTAKAKQLNKHLILTAHERHTYKKGDKMGDAPTLVKISPFFTGVDKNPDLITQYFDNVWRTSAVSGGSSRIYRITTQGDEIISAKTRWAGVFDTVEKDMTWLKCLERIRQSDPSKALKGVR